MPGFNRHIEVNESVNVTASFSQKYEHKIKLHSIVWRGVEFKVQSIESLLSAGSGISQRILSHLPASPEFISKDNRLSRITGIQPFHSTNPVHNDRNDSQSTYEALMSSMSELREIGKFSGLRGLGVEWGDSEPKTRTEPIWHNLPDAHDVRQPIFSLLLHAS